MAKEVLWKWFHADDECDDGQPVNDGGEHFRPEFSRFLKF